MGPVGMQHNLSVTAGTPLVVVPCMSVPAGGMGQMQEGDQRVQGHTLELLVLGLVSALPLSAIPSTALCWHSSSGQLGFAGGEASPDSTMGKGIGFFLGKAACSP